MSVQFEKVVVLGTGLIGGSLAGALRSRKLARAVVGVGRSRANLDVALERGLVDSASCDVAEAVDGADLVVLAAPVDRCVVLMSELAALGAKLRGDALLTDVASVKRTLATAAAAAGMADRYVGGHPMAGAARSGAVASDPALFEGRLVVLTPGSAAAAAVARIAAMWKAVGARVLETSVQRHDRLVARASHLPQMVAWTLAETLAIDGERAGVVEMAAGGLRDMTRLAESDYEMWRAIVEANRDELVAALDAFAERLTALRAAVSAADDAALREVADRARGLRAEIDSK